MSLRHDDNQRTPIIVEEVHSSTSPSDHDQIVPPRRTKKSSKSHHNHSSSSKRYDLDSRRFLLRDDRDDGRKLSALLLFTSERLELETQRADNEERRATSYATRLRSAIEAKDRADQDITRISEELRLYKLQLDAAQKEIFRAQDVLQMVEKQKYDAELDAAKARTTARDLLEEKTIMIAREEGRKLGYKDGLRRGRTLGYEEGRSVGYEDGQAYSQRLATPDIYDEENEPPEEEYDERTKSPPRSLVLDISRPPSTHRSRRSRSRGESSRSRIGAASQPPLPVTAPMPIPPPGQIQTPAAVPVPIPIPAPPLSHSPEKIQPMPSRNSARSPSRHSVDIPPDNWIPTADGNSFIAMPPPHEFSIPIDANPTPRTNTRSLDGNDAGERGTRPPSRQQHPQVRTRDYAYADTAPSGSAPQPPPSRPRTNSGASRGSTRISQYDLVSPPRNQKPEDSDRKGNGDAYSVQSYTRRGREREREVQRERSRTPGLDSRTRRGQPESERIVEEWRSANPDVVTPRNSTDGRMPNDPPSPQQQHRRQQAYSKVPGKVEVTSPFTVAQRVANLTRPPLSTIVARPQSPVIEWLFGKRLNRRASSSPPPISIQPPSKSPSEHSQATLVHPNLLSPEDANRPLPDDPPQQQGDYLSTEQGGAPPLVVHMVDSIPSVSLPNGQLPMSSIHPRSPRNTSALGPSPQPGPSYALAPIPPGVTYPDPPLLPATTAGLPRPSSRAGGSPPTQDVRHRGQSFSATSPAPLQRPISIFSD